jgi:ATP-dependent RNA helicase MSS116
MDTHSAADPDPTLPSFNTLKGVISDQTFNAITQTPFHLTTMSPVQAAVFPLLPQITQPHNPDPPPAGSPRPTRDLLVKAKTGTGKTMAFLVPAIEARLNAIEAAGKKAVADAGLKSDSNLEERAKRKFARDQVGTLILSPTRELATQIANEAKKLFRNHDMEVRLFHGGANKRPQMHEWMKGRRDIVVSTPGRMRDMLMTEPDVAHGISKTKLVGV